MNSFDITYKSSRINYNPKHVDHACVYPEAFSVMTIIDTDEENKECRGFVPDYLGTAVVEIPESSTDIEDIVGEFNGLFVSVPGVAEVHEFRNRTGNTNPTKTPP